MTSFGDGTFGKGLEFKTEITNGECPLCRTKGVFVSLYENVFRCISCGGDIEQKVNGVISFMPLSHSLDKKRPSMSLNKRNGS